MIRINYVKKFHKNHRTIVSVTVTPHWFLRIFFWAKPKEVAFISYGKEWVQFFEDDDENCPVTQPMDMKDFLIPPTTTTK